MRPLLFLLSILACTILQSAQATSPPPPPDHVPARAQCALLSLVSALNASDPAAFPRFPVVSDTLGTVDMSERAQFLAELRGKATGPVELINWQLVRHSRNRAVYIVRLGVEPLQVGRVVSTNEPVFMHRAESSWFVSFYSNHITDMRSADELWLLAESAQSTPKCQDASNG